MRVKEFTAPKSAVDVEAEALKKQKGALADRTSANKVRKAQQALAKQRQKAGALRKTGSATPNSTPR